MSQTIGLYKLRVFAVSNFVSHGLKELSGPGLERHKDALESIYQEREGFDELEGTIFDENNACWNNYHEQMLEYSKKEDHEDFVFELTVDAPDDFLHHRIYYHRGRYQFEPVREMFNPFDVNKLREPNSFTCRLDNRCLNQCAYCYFNQEEINRNQKL